MRKLPVAIQNKILQLRIAGKSIPEISQELGIGKTTVQRYVCHVTVTGGSLDRLRLRQGGSRERALAHRAYASQEADKLLGQISIRDQLMLIIGLYWGEGTKRDFEIINSDPALIATFISSLKVLGITQERLGVSIRIHRGISVPLAVKYWSKVTGVSAERIKRVEVIDGKKKGKLKFGMCRVRVHSGIKERLLLQAMISRVGNMLWNK